MMFTTSVRRTDAPGGHQVYADHTVRSRRVESPRPRSGCAARASLRGRPPSSRFTTPGRARRAALWLTRPGTRVIRGSGKTRPQREDRVGLGTQRGSQPIRRRTGFSTRCPRERRPECRPTRGSTGTPTSNRRHEAPSLALGSASELEYHLLLARDLALLPEPEYAHLAGLSREVKRMLSGLATSLTADVTLKADG